MLNFFRNLFWGSTLEKKLYSTKKVRIDGVTFTIQKVNVLHYLEGYKSLQQLFDIYKLNPGKELSASDKKLMEFLSNVLVAGVVNPKLSFKEDGEGIHIDKLFVNIDMVMELYSQIMAFTYGKKKTLFHT